MIDALFRNGCDDGTVGRSEGVQFIIYDREVRLVNIFPESSSTRQVNHRGFLSEQGYTRLFPSINHQLKKFLSISRLAIN